MWDFAAVNTLNYFRGNRIFGANATAFWSIQQLDRVDAIVAEGDVGAVVGAAAAVGVAFVAVVD